MQLVLSQHPEALISPAIISSEPYKYGRKQDYGTGLFNKAPATLPHAAQHIANGWQMISRQFHNKGGRLPCKSSGLFQHYAGDDYSSHTDEISRGSYQCGTVKYSACYHGYERDLGAAGYKGSSHNRHAAVALVLYGTGSHNAGYAAAGTYKHGDKAFAGKPELAEKTVKHKGDAGHIAAGFQKGQQQEQHQHLWDKAQHCADAGNYTIQNKAAEPLGSAGLFQTVAYQHRYTGYPNAVICRIRLIKAIGRKIAYSLLIGHGNSGFFIRRLRYGVIIGSQLGDGKGLFILRLNHSSFPCRMESFHSRQLGSSIKIFRPGIQAHKSVNSLNSGGIFFVHLFIGRRTNAQKMPAFPEQSIVCPVCSSSSHCYHGYIIDQKHDGSKNRQPQPTVGDYTVYLIRSGHFAGAFLFIAALDDLGYINIPLIGYYGFSIVVQLLFGSPDILFHMGHHLSRDIHLLQNFIIPLEYLNPIPALLTARHIMDHCFLYMRQGMLYRAGKIMHRHSMSGTGSLYGGLGSLHDPLPPEG